MTMCVGRVRVGPGQGPGESFQFYMEKRGKKAEAMKRSIVLFFIAFTSLLHRLHRHKPYLACSAEGFGELFL